MPRKPAQPISPAGNSPVPQREEVIVYENGADVRLDVRTDGETVWLTQEQMCRLFGRTQPVIARHISNIFKEGELDKKVVYAKIAYTTRMDAAETNIEQVKQGVSYLVKQLSSPPPAPPRRKIGFQ